MWLAKDSMIALALRPPGCGFGRNAFTMRSDRILLCTLGERLWLQQATPPGPGPSAECAALEQRLVLQQGAFCRRVLLRGKLCSLVPRAVHDSGLFQTARLMSGSGRRCGKPPDGKMSAHRAVQGTKTSFEKRR